ncbi:MAG: rubredoxin [Mucilaginibacter sp.]
MATEHVIKINLPGGITSAGDLYEILVIAANAGAKSVRFGNRQQLFFNISGDSLEDMETAMFQADIDFEIDNDEYPNIISSYVCDTIFNQESWLKEGVYRDIFDLFNYQPRLKINIIDSHQTFIPFFSGNFNFISSEVSNYWYLYVRFPKTNKFYCWPQLIYSDDIAAISKKAEDVIMTHKNLFYEQQTTDEKLFFDMVTRGSRFQSQALQSTLNLPDFNLPYYEGFNKYTGNKYWLGIYRRNELFDIDFLKDVCNLCLKERIGQINITPWKSILIKGIEQARRVNWGVILDRYRLNIRHAANELNWQIEDLSDEGLALKQRLVREFEEADLRTYRLCFTIKTRPKSGLQGSIIIKTQKSGEYEILHTHNFNPNSKEYISYKSDVNEKDLGAELIQLCYNYYQLSINNKYSPEITQAETAASVKELHQLYQCKHCKTVYDSTYGDEENNIAAGTDFITLAAYSCPVCSAGKESFELVAESDNLSLWTN